MKPRILLLLLLPIYCFGQSRDTLAYILKANYNMSMYDSIRGVRGYDKMVSFIKTGDIMYAASLIKFEDNNYYWHVWVDSVCGYVKDDPYYIDCPDSIRQSYKNIGSKNDSLRLRQCNRLMNYVKVTNKINRLENEIKYLKNGFLINDWSWAYSNEYSSFIDVSFTVTNYADKTIKYVWVYLNAYDAVDTKLSYLGKSIITLKGVGPIPFKSQGDYNFDDVFYSKIVNKIKIVKVRIQYMDNSFKEYIGKNIMID